MSAPFALNAPFSQEAEEAVLGSILTNVPVFWQVAQQLIPEDFFLLRHTRIFQAMHRVMERHNTMDFLVVAEELRTMKVFEEVGGHAYLMQLINNTPTSVHATIYAGLVAVAAVRRKMMESADTMRELAMDENINVNEAMDRAEESLIQITRHRETSHRITIKDAMEDTDEVLRQRIRLFQKNPNYIIGVCSGIQGLDKHIDGFQPGLSVLAGNTGMGKTAAAMTVALNASKSGNQQDEPLPCYVHLFSGEMTQMQMNFRLLSMKSGIPMDKLMRGELNQQTYNQYTYAKHELDALHALTFESGKQLTLPAIRNRVRELVNSQQLDLFILDGLMQIDAGSGKKPTRYQEQKRRDAIETILNELEVISMTYKIPFLVTHQVNRETKKRADMRPQLSDMAEASFVEWKSSVVIGVYRESYHNREEIPRPDGLQEAELIILKNRHGAPGLIHCLYDAKRTVFINGTLHHGDLSKDE